MDPTNTVCPVCTLFLRPGITLKDHLSSHPKHKVIEALVKLSSIPDTPKLPATPPESVVSTPPTNTAVVNNQTWNQQIQAHVPASPTVHPVPGNHVFIYQQSMSTTTPQGNVLNVNPLSQQYVYPTVFNPQMMPYVYQQQQVIMSSNSLPPNIRALPPFELSGTPTTNNSELTVVSPTEEILSDDEGDKHNGHIEDSIKEHEGTCEMGIKKQEACPDTINLEEVKTIEDFKNQDDRFEEIQSETYPAEDELHENNCSPHSQTQSEWTFHPELNKACQTHILNNSSPKSQTVEDDDRIEESQCISENPDNSNYLYENDPSNQYQQGSDCFNQHTVTVPFTTVKMNVDTFEQSEPIYTSANILHGNDNMDFVNMDEVVIIGDFSTNHLISRVENFENTMPDRSRVLMTIGSLDEHVKNDFNDHRDPDESMSRGSSHLNIRSDERMPARGELSGQESIGGASDITWNRLQYQEGSSRMCNSYDLMERGRWDASDSDSVDSPSTPRRDSTSIPYYENDPDNENDTPTIVSYSGPPLNFKCPICGDDFATSKERKAHELEKHPERNNKNSIGLDIGKKKVKKLVVKPKAQVSKVEQSFDTVFTNKLKQESIIDIQETKLQDPSLNQNESGPNVRPDSNAVSKCIKTVCSICDCVFENVSALKQHKQEAHQDLLKTKNKCSTCNEVFPNEYRFTEHLRIHPLECRLCGKLFYRKQNIQLHMKRHLGLKPYKCEICQKSFVTRQKHDEHKTVHTGEAPIKCTLCDEKFRRHSNLVEHRNRHHYLLKKKLKDYICHCGEIFHSKKKLAWHKETHEGKPKACTECNEKFLHMSSLTRHMRRAHNQTFLPEETRQNENVECPICKRTFLKSSLEVHIRNHSGDRPFQCPICNKDFTTKWNLKLHKWTHASRTSKPFKCDQCKGAFIRETDYISHMNSHKSVRPYTCNFCGAKFIRKYNCLRHVKEHESNKRYACNVCGKSFHRSYYLKDHMRVHSGIRPYTCHICGKTSATKSNHNKHVQIHHAREPVSTEN